MMDASTRGAAIRRTPHLPGAGATLRELVFAAVRHRWTVLAVLLLAPAIGLAAALLLPRTYRAQSDILVRSGREYLPQSDTGGSVAAPSTTKQEDITSEMTILGSRAVAETVINSFGLDRLFPDIAADPPTNSSPMDAAVELFSRKLGVEPVKMSNIIAVSFDADSPDEARLVLDRAVATYIDKHAQVFAGRRTEGYEDATDKIRAELERTQGTLSRIKLDAGIYDIAAQRTALIARREEADTHAAEAVNRQETLRARLAFLLAQRPRVPATVQTTSTDRNDESVHARTALTDLRQAEAAAAARLGDANPELQRIRSQIAALSGIAAAAGPNRTNTSNAPSPVAQAIDTEIVMDRAELASLDGAIDRSRTERARADAELQRLERADLDLRTAINRVDVLTDSYRASQARLEQARTLEQTELARQVSVVQIAPAIAADKPVKPRRLLWCAGGVLAGLLLAGTAVVCATLFNRRPGTEEAVARLLGLPVLASLPLRPAGHAS